MSWLTVGSFFGIYLELGFIELVHWMRLIDFDLREMLEQVEEEVRKHGDGGYDTRHGLPGG